MRAWLIGLMLSVLSAGNGLAAEQATYPYTAYVASAQARIVAGPGKAYYATDELSRGMQVEVYRQIGDWLAIRPPSGCFSWVPAREAELTDEPDLAQIVNETPAWIGTRVERDAPPVWQVQLHPGDVVKILDVKRRPAAGGKAAETWYRIEPPAGEFRFIRAEDVTQDEMAEEAAPPSELAASVVGQAKPLAAEPAAEEEDSESVAQAQFVPRDRTAKKPQEVSAPSANNSSPFKEVGSERSPRVAALDKLPPTDATALLTASGRFEDKLAEIELQLARIAARDPRDWQLEPIHQQAEMLLAEGKTTLERGRARLVLDKITQFEELALRAGDVSAAPRSTIVRSVEEKSLPVKDEQPQDKTAGLKLPEGVTYDAVGWLKQVYSEKKIVPPYALVDAEGQVLCYVTPTPGLNLSRYVRKPVGIFGQKGHLAQFKNAPHVTANRIVELTKYQSP